MQTIKNAQVPYFSVPAFVEAEEFKTVTKNDIPGRWAIFFFYPADFYFVCPTEPVDMADNYSRFNELEADLFVAEHGDQVCPARWKRGDTALTPGIELVGKI